MSSKCRECKGTGLVSSETGEVITNEAAGWRSDAIQCAYCDGTGVEDETPS